MKLEQPAVYHHFPQHQIINCRNRNLSAWLDLWILKSKNWGDIKKYEIFGLVLDEYIYIYNNNMMYQADINMETWLPWQIMDGFLDGNLHAIQRAGNGGCFHASFLDLSSASDRSTVSCNFSASTVILSPETCTKIHWFISMFLVRIVESLGQTGQT